MEKLLSLCYCALKCFVTLTKPVVDVTKPKGGCDETEKWILTRPSSFQCILYSFSFSCCVLMLLFHR